MIYLIDGYNLLFLFTSKDSLKKQRNLLIEKIQKLFCEKNLLGILVFDGANRENEESGFAYASPLEIVYTPKRKSADEWIVDKIESSKKRSDFIVVTDDAGLKKNVRHLGANVMSREDFLLFIFKQKSLQDLSKKEVKESSRSFERLLKIFTERLEKGIDDL